MKKQIQMKLTLAVVACCGLTGCETCCLTQGTRAKDGIKIVREPTDQLVLVGKPATFSVVAEARGGKDKATLAYQWLRNCEILPSETNYTFTISKVTTNEVGMYSCRILRHSEDTPNQLKMTEPAFLSASTTTNADGVFTVWGTPLSGNGSVGTCPGAYVGYVNFSKPAPPYGWTRSGTNLKACDGTGRATKIKAFGNTFNDYPCGPSCLNWSSPKSTVYRFTIYFPTGPMPTGSYPLTLTGFYQ